MGTHAWPIALVDDLRFDAHAAPGGGHPECPERLVAAREGLRGSVPGHRLAPLSPHLATTDELVGAHTAAYVTGLEAALKDGVGHLDPDTFFSQGTREASWLAAGGAASLARALVTQGPQDTGNTDTGTATGRAGLALLRPPGHHAEPDSAMGFCLLNNVAVAAHAARRAGAQRVAIVDWDVHHGNGTQAAFYADPNVLFISLHQFPFYPGTGRSEELGQGQGTGKTLNLPLPAGCGPEAYGYAFRRAVLPALASFRPDLVLVSAGFDAHAADPLAMMHLDAASYQAMACALLTQHDRVGLLLEGGYDLPALASSVASVGKALVGEALELPIGEPPAAAKAAVDRTCALHAPYWPGTFEPRTA